MVNAEGIQTYDKGRTRWKHGSISRTHKSRDDEDLGVSEDIRKIDIGENKELTKKTRYRRLYTRSGESNEVYMVRR